MANTVQQAAATQTLNAQPSTDRTIADVAVIGAGLAGLICAQRLQQAGLRVIVVEKSRGLGGRMATRRLPNSHADHGVRYLDAQGLLTQQLIDRCSAHQILQPWLDRIHIFDRTGLHPSQPQARYAAKLGITAVAKALGSGLEIWRGQRVQVVTTTPESLWNLRLEPVGEQAFPPLSAKSLVMTIPAPQALTLLEPLLQQGLVPELVQRVRSVQFAPCITAIAAYAAAQRSIAATSPWQAVRFLDDPDLDWVAIDSSKQPEAPDPVVVVQSSPRLAQDHLETADLQPIGQHLLDRAAHALAPWLASPAILQVHRWRYAFASQSLSDHCIATEDPLPLVCGGDWCGGNDIESALRSGVSAAEQIALCLQGASLQTASFQVANLSNLEIAAMLAEIIAGIGKNN
ncbi:NAD(P)/FAD-dependent oxidoreductase [Egbenema bharatensis]|uniref:NAD(P)/FAD-dependent oxidoreductase n=1 Tax=Egbenema bharatensis TaxID=3463334 RepID=UPI003A894BB0